MRVNRGPLMRFAEVVADPSEQPTAVYQRFIRWIDAGILPPLTGGRGQPVPEVPDYWARHATFVLRASRLGIGADTLRTLSDAWGAATVEPRRAPPRPFALAVCVAPVRVEHAAGVTWVQPPIPGLPVVNLVRDAGDVAALLASRYAVAVVPL